MKRKSSRNWNLTLYRRFWLWAGQLASTFFFSCVAYSVLSCNYSLASLLYICSALTAKIQYRKIETNIPKKGIAQPQSQFPHVFVSDLYTPTIKVPILFAGKYVDRSWEYIIRSQTHKCGNGDWGRAIPRKGIHKWDFHSSALFLIWYGNSGHLEHTLSPYALQRWRSL